MKEKSFVVQQVIHLCNPRMRKKFRITRQADFFPFQILFCIHSYVNVAWCYKWRPQESRKLEKSWGRNNMSLLTKQHPNFFLHSHFQKLKMKPYQLGSVDVKYFHLFKKILIKTKFSFHFFGWLIFTVYWVLILFFTLPIDHAMWSNFKWDISTLEWLEKNFFGFVRSRLVSCHVKCSQTKWNAKP